MDRNRFTSVSTTSTMNGPQGSSSSGGGGSSGNRTYDNNMEVTRNWNCNVVQSNLTPTAREFIPRSGRAVAANSNNVMESRGAIKKQMVNQGSVGHQVSRHRSPKRKGKGEHHNEKQRSFEERTSNRTVDDDFGNSSKHLSNNSYGGNWYNRRNNQGGRYNRSNANSKMFYGKNNNGKYRENNRHGNTDNWRTAATKENLNLENKAHSQRETSSASLQKKCK